MYRIESFFRGDDYRISVLDGEVICAYQRIPLSIVGNGIDTIQTLLQLQQNLFDTTVETLFAWTHSTLTQYPFLLTRE